MITYNVYVPLPGAPHTPIKQSSDYTSQVFIRPCELERENGRNVSIGRREWETHMGGELSVLMGSVRIVGSLGSVGSLEVRIVWGL